ASGMAAIACTIDQIFRNTGPGAGHLVSARTVYGGTYALLKNILPARGIDVSFVEISDLASVERAIRPGTKMIYAETLSNPLLTVTDIRALADLCKKRKLTLVIDNTFAPLMVRPIDLGADVVVHSCTKYISGSSD